MPTTEEINVLKEYAPKCKHCDHDCQIAWDSYGKINFHHCHDCHFKYIGKGYYIAEKICG